MLGEATARCMVCSRDLLLSRVLEKKGSGLCEGKKMMCYTFNGRERQIIVRKQQKEQCEMVE